jgi:hypothetical protein
MRVLNKLPAVLLLLSVPVLAQEKGTEKGQRAGGSHAVGGGRVPLLPESSSQRDPRNRLALRDPRKFNGLPHRNAGLLRISQDTRKHPTSMPTTNGSDTIPAGMIPAIMSIIPLSTDDSRVVSGLATCSALPADLETASESAISTSVLRRLTMTIAMTGSGIPILSRFTKTRITTAGTSLTIRGLARTFMSRISAEALGGYARLSEPV